MRRRSYTAVARSEMSSKISSVLIERLTRVATSGRFLRATGAGSGASFNVRPQSMSS
jgi:hypothetical protein